MRACRCLVGPSSLVDLVFCADDAREASGWADARARDYLVTGAPLPSGDVVLVGLDVTPSARDREKWDL
jgi:hypothetical protein